MMNLNDDTEELEDFIRLDFADLQASENLQLLDPGIIDLECDSDECTTIEEIQSFHGQPDLHSQSVTTPNSNTIALKPMCIKVVDCYKFPWYFGKFKDVIEHKIPTVESVDGDDGILDDSSTDSDPAMDLVETNFVDISVVDSVTMQRHTNDYRQEVAESNKKIEATAAKEIVNKKTITGAKCVRNNAKNSKIDFDIRRAMEQRKSSVVDLKRNIGLVGMKILRLPNKIPSQLPIDISVRKRLKKPKAQNTEKEQGNTQEKGPTCTQVKGFTNETSTTPGIDLDQRCNFGNKFSDLSVNKVAEKIHRLVTPHNYAGNINQTITTNSCNTTTTPTKVTEDKIIRSSKYYSKSFQKYIGGARTSKMIDPIPISLRKRKKNSMKSHLPSKASEIIDISDEMSPKLPTSKLERTSFTEANIIRNKTPDNIKDYKAKEMESKNICIVKPKIVLSTKKSNKLTETIIKIKEKQQKQSSLTERTKSHKQSSNTTPTFTLSKSISEYRSLPKEIDTSDVIFPDYKNISTQEQLFNENAVTNIIKSSCSTTSIAQLQKSNRNDYENAPSKDNHLQNTTKNDASTDSDILVKLAKKEIEKMSKNNYIQRKQIINESYMTVNREENNNTAKNKSVTENIVVEVKLIDSTKEKLKQHHGTHQYPAVNPIKTATDNFAIPTIDSNREAIISCTKVHTVSNHNSNANSPEVIVNTTTQNNQSQIQVMEPLTVHNSMQAHTLYKPPESTNETFRESQCNAVRVSLHKPQVNQSVDDYTDPSLNLTQHPKEILPHIGRPPSSGVIENILPQMNHWLPMPTLQPKNFGALMLNGISTNMPTYMSHPEPYGGFGAQIPSNSKPISSFGVSSQISKPQGTVFSQIPLNYPQIGGMQSHDILWSKPFTCIPPPPPLPPPPYLPASQDISNSSQVSLPQSLDSSIIGRNLNGIVKKINITAPVIEKKEEIHNNVGIIEIENLERDTSTPLNDEPTDYFEDIEPVNTKKEMLRILDNGLQKVFGRFDILTTTKGIGKLGKSPKENIHEKYDSGTRKKNSDVQNLLEVDRSPTKDNQKNYKTPQKKESQHKNNHNLINFIRKSKEKKEKLKEIPLKKSNESLRNRVENVTDLIHESGNIKISANQSTCIPEQKKYKEINKKHILDHFTQDSKKGHKSKTLSGKTSKLIFEDLFGDDVDDAGEKVATDQKSTEKRHFSSGNTEKTSEKTFESSVILKRPANDEKSALSPKYRPGPLSKKKKFSYQEKVNPHQVNKKQILQSKTYSDPILPIPTYEKILSNMPSYLCFRDDMKKSTVTENSSHKKPSGSVNPKIADPEKKRNEKERQKHDKAESIKKISLYEYKKRSTSERKVDNEVKDYMHHVEMHRRPSHADSDLGYDSDSTVKL